MMETSGHGTVVRAKVALLAVVVAALVIAPPLLLASRPSPKSADPSPEIVATSQESQDVSASTREASGEGHASDGDVADSQRGADSARAQMASGDGLRVENNTGESVVLRFPDGDVVGVDAGRSVVVLRPCSDTLPLKAERVSGELIAVRDAP